MKEESTCIICNTIQIGKICDWRIYCDSKETKRNDILSYSCKNCGVNVCIKCKKKYLKKSWLRPWGKIICPKCGKWFGPGILHIKYQSSLKWHSDIAVTRRVEIYDENHLLPEQQKNFHKKLINELEHMTGANPGLKIQLRWNKYEYETYKDGSTGYRIGINIKIIDRSTSKTLGYTFLYGKNPPESFWKSPGDFRAEHLYGAFPLGEIVNYIKNFKFETKNCPKCSEHVPISGAVCGYCLHRFY